MSQDFFQCLVCNVLFESLWKVEKHIKHHDNDNVIEESRNTESIGRRRGMLPIKKVSFYSCFVPVVKNEIDPAFLAQYGEVQAKEEPTIKGDLDASDYLSLECNNDCDNVDDAEDTGRVRRSSRLRAAINIRRAAAVLLIPEQGVIDDDQDEDFEFVQNVLAELPEDEDDDFEPPSFIRKSTGKPKKTKTKPPPRKSSKATVSWTNKTRKKLFPTSTSKSYHCEYCPKSFRLQNDLCDHLYERHQDQAHMITCPILSCGRPSLNFLTLRSHLHLHTSAERKEYDLTKQLERQVTPEEAAKKLIITSLHDKINILCKFCLQKFESLYLLRNHITKDHSDTTILKCPCCNENTSEGGTDMIITLLSHIKGRHPERIDPYNERYAINAKNRIEKQFKCDKCNASFKYQRTLKKHLKHHEITLKKRQLQDNDPSRKFTCPVCQRKFKFKDNLRRHFTLHLENNPYVCDFPNCQKKFNSDYNLRRHKALHNEQFGHKEVQRMHCPLPLCNASFNRRDMLRRHLRNVHTPDDEATLNSTTTPSKKRMRAYQCRLPSIGRIPRYPTYKDLSIEESNQDSAPTASTTPSKSTERNTAVKVEAAESAAIEEIHLVDRIILGPDGNPTHVMGETITPITVSVNRSAQLVPGMPSPAQFDGSSVINQTSSLTIHSTPLTKLITSDPIFEKLSKEDPTKVQDIVAKQYNYSPGKIFTCQQCDSIFSRAWTLQLHLKTKHNKTIMDIKESKTGSSCGGTDDDNSKITLMCGTCAYPAKNAKELAKHIKLTHKFNSKCPHCGLFFEDSRRVHRHIQEIHGSARNFQCQYCPQTFTNSQYRRTHERKIHENHGKPREKKRCSFPGCNILLTPRSFYNHMQRHKKQQEGKEGPKCMLCHDVFTCPMSLRRHIDAVHLGKPINKRKKSQGLKEGEVPKKGVVVRRGPKKSEDEWFQPLLDKVIAETVGIDDVQEESKSNSGQENGEDGIDDEEVLNSILGF